MVVPEQGGLSNPAHAGQNLDASLRPSDRLCRRRGAWGEAMVGRFYGLLYKMKRSCILSFVLQFDGLGRHLKYPKAVSRNLRVKVVRLVEAGQGTWTALRRAKSSRSGWARTYDNHELSIIIMY